MDSLKRFILKYRYVLGGILLILVFFGTASWRYLLKSPSTFPKSTLVHIDDTADISTIANDFQSKHLIQNAVAFKLLLKLLQPNTFVVPGDYIFSYPQNAVRIALRLKKGDHGILPIRITIPEGTDVDDIGLILLKKMPNFNAPLFYSRALQYQGYLFPDTYLFEQNATVDEIIAIMRGNFDKKVEAIRPAWFAPGQQPSQKDVISMAAVLEKEAPTNEARRLIAGILWKRLDAGMPLQVDVDPTTYKNKGLPAFPITNPGLDAITDALAPTPSRYWFYISDRNGAMHYSKTFDEHRANILKYLK